MKVIRSEKHERMVFDKIKAWLAKRPRSADAWHVSDLLYPLKAYWQRLFPLPITDDQALYFILGIAHHSILEAILGPKDKTEKRADAGEFLKDGIYYSPDLRLPYPLEIKTSRAYKAPDDSGQKPEKAFEGYLKQETLYQAFMDSKKGALLVVFLNKMLQGEKWKKKPALRFYKVLCEPKELKKKLEVVKILAKTLTAAVKTKNPKGLELCPDWMCQDCGWFAKCRPWIKDPSRKNAQKKGA